MLISVSELAQELHNPNVVVLDCRFTLGNPSDGRRRYLEGHIPGAVYLDLEQDLSGPKQTHGGRHPLPAPETFAAALSAAGVTKDTHIVIYDDGEGMAPRAWWLVRYMGHDDCVILNGGYKAWLAQGLPVDTAVPDPRPGKFVPAVRQDWVVTTETVEQIASGERPGVLVDARARERYLGEVETIDPRAGHIPTAKNAPWMEGVNREDGTWKSKEEQQKRFQPPAEGQYVMYCGSGVTACANLFALELAGIRGAKLYPGSWSDWCSYADHPVAVDDENG